MFDKELGYLDQTIQDLLMGNIFRSRLASPGDVARQPISPTPDLIQRIRCPLCTLIPR